MASLPECLVVMVATGQDTLRATSRAPKSWSLRVIGVIRDMALGRDILIK